MAFKKDTVMGTMIFTVTLCLLCSFMITGTAELLKERKLAKQRDEIKRFVLIASNVEVAEGQDFRSVFDERVTPKLINLNTGDAEAMATADIMNFDERMAAINPQTATKPKKDTARIRSRAQDVRVFEVRDGQGKLASIVLPVYGKGLWSMIYGYVAVEADLNTIENVVFYEHGETPGIGDFLNDPEWTDKFQGKQLFDDKGKVSFSVVKGGAKAGDIHGVDAVSGATMTGRGVQRAIQFWFGTEGFQVFFDKIRASEAAR